MPRLGELLPQGLHRRPPWPLSRGTRCCGTVCSGVNACVSMAPSAAVDEVWRQLNNSGAASKRADKLLRGLASGAGMPQGDPQASSKHRGSMCGAKPVEAIRADKDQQVACRARLELNVGRIVSELTDPDQCVRRAALQQTKVRGYGMRCLRLAAQGGTLGQFSDTAHGRRCRPPLATATASVLPSTTTPAWPRACCAASQTPPSPAGVHTGHAMHLAVC